MVNAIEWKALAYDEDGNSTPVTLTETGLGQYEASVPLKGNRMALQLVDSVYGKVKTLQWNRAYPDEYRLSSPFQKSLREQPSYVAEEIRAGVMPVVIKSTALPLFGFLALLFLFLSVLFRRI